MSTVAAARPLMFDNERGRLVSRAGYALQNALGETLALFREWSEQEEWLDAAKSFYDDARTCGHPGAAGWVAERLPLVVRPVTEEQWESILDDGTPWLQVEP